MAARKVFFNISKPFKVIKESPKAKQLRPYSSAMVTLSLRSYSDLDSTKIFDHEVSTIPIEPSSHLNTSMMIELYLSRLSVLKLR